MAGEFPPFEELNTSIRDLVARERAAAAAPQPLDGPNVAQQSFLEYVTKSATIVAKQLKSKKGWMGEELTEIPAGGGVFGHPIIALRPCLKYGGTDLDDESHCLELLPEEANLVASGNAQRQLVIELRAGSLIVAQESSTPKRGEFLITRHGLYGTQPEHWFRSEVVQTMADADGLKAVFYSELTAAVARSLTHRA